MTFWSSQTLDTNLGRLIPSGERPKIDCNAIELTVGREIYISPSWPEGNLPQKTVKLLDPGESFAVPPGQFGFLQSVEIVEIPHNTMGFISFKSTFKMMGLVNVSGFHVDPGWRGPLTFAVFNAGPSPVHLRQGMELFLLWISFLDEDSEVVRTKELPDNHFIQTVNRVSGPVKSGYDLHAKVEQLEQKIAKLEVWRSILAVLIIGIFLRWVAPALFLPDQLNGENQAAEAEDVATP